MRLEYYDVLRCNPRRVRPSARRDRHGTNSRPLPFGEPRHDGVGPARRHGAGGRLKRGSACDRPGVLDQRDVPLLVMTFRFSVRMGDCMNRWKVIGALLAAVGGRVTEKQRPAVDRAAREVL